MGFDHIRGHERVLKILSRTIESDRLSHAYIFMGPDGIGKRLVAKAFAKMLLCSSGGAQSCDVCSSCRQVEAGTHPDLHVVEPEKGTVPVDSIRGLQQELSRTSFAGRYKVCIVDEAEKMNDASQNSLLKTLEEPTPETLLVLITGQPYQLLPTVRSRCQQVTFEPLATSVAAELIREKKSVDEATATLLASVTGGSPGKALSIDISDFEGLRERLVHGFGQDQGKELFSLAEELSREKETLDFRINLVRLWFRDLMIYKLYQGEEHLINRDKLEEIVAQSRLWSVEHLLNGLFWIEEHALSLEANVSPRLSMETLVLRMAPGAQSYQGSGARGQGASIHR